jgi:hypothetical protein
MSIVPPVDTSAAQDLPAAQRAGPPTPHANSGRRLSKTLMRADSQDVAGSKNWGLVTIPKPGGEPTVIRVIQSEVAEDSNMMKITWMWSHKDVTHQVELRHGRRSGIRKIYVDKVLQDRIKSVRNLLSDTGSSHDFKVGEHEGAVTISPKGVTGFTYQLRLDGQGIEQSIVRPPAPAGRARRLARARHPMGLAAPRRRTARKPRRRSTLARARCSCRRRRRGWA